MNFGTTTKTFRTFTGCTSALRTVKQSGLADFVRVNLNYQSGSGRPSDLDEIINRRFRRKRLLRVWKSISQLPFIIWRDVAVTFRKKFFCHGTEKSGSCLCDDLLHEKDPFLSRIVTCDETWIVYDDVWHRRSWKQNPWLKRACIQWSHCCAFGGVAASSSRWNNNCKKVLWANHQSQCGYSRKTANWKSVILYTTTTQDRMLQNRSRRSENKPFYIYCILLTWIHRIFICSNFYITMTKNWLCTVS